MSPATRCDLVVSTEDLIFLISLTQVLGQYFKIGHDLSLPDPSQFIICNLPFDVVQTANYRCKENKSWKRPSFECIALSLYDFFFRFTLVTDELCVFLEV
jgi:hypothetical protein